MIECTLLIFSMNNSFIIVMFLWEKYVINVLPPYSHPATRRRSDIVTTSLCTSQWRRRYVSKETPSDVSVERRQDVSVVRLHDVSNKSQMKHSMTSQWYVTKTSQWYVFTTSYWYVVMTSHGDVMTTSHQYVSTTSQTILK